MTTRTLLLSLFASTAFACMHGPAHHEPAPAATPPQSTGSAGQMSGMKDVCPMDVHGQEMHGDMSAMMMPPPSRAAVEDVENGARIVVTPNDPADLSKLQSTVRMHAQHLREQGCEMMHGAADHH